jgi:hypothetical protein
VTNPWVAVAAPADLVGVARTIGRARDAVLEGHPAPGVVRAVVTQSWERCARAGVDPERTLAPIHLDEAEVADRWERHPLHAAMDSIQALLGDFCWDASHLAVIMDVDGCLIYLDGHPSVRRQAERMHFVPGAQWSESAAGTNAPGTALAVGHFVQIFSTEHFSRIVHPWTCAAAPVRDPDTGLPIAAIDLTSRLKTAHPHSLALALAAARLAESELVTLARQRDEKLRARFAERAAGGGAVPAGVANLHGAVLASRATTLPSRLEVPPEGGEVVLPGGARLLAERVPDGHLLWAGRSHGGRAARDTTLRLDVLGRDVATATLGSTSLRLTRRHSEILLLLALHPRGMTGEQLEAELYGDEVHPVTIRAEMSRLRPRLGPWLAAKPYRLLCGVSCDLLDVQHAVERGDVAEALERYGGPVLAASSAPGIVTVRRRTERALRRSLLEAEDADGLWRWSRGPGAGDVSVLRALVRTLEPGDPRRGPALAELEEARERAPT